ncbi:MAG: citrate lyase acyl carrier protein [Treponema sp.]|jgi:citrate lyase subunit gamma (acyl carrier protein)|nr:citrate lyase acyl carrier protein [Treponema sp.]
MEIQQNSVAGTMESSDIMISLAPGSSGIEIDLQSIVEKQFGQEIRRAITETLDSLAVKNVRVQAVDKGALDCVIRARVKTAVYRASGDSRYNWKVSQ